MIVVNKTLRELAINAGSFFYQRKIFAAPSAPPRSPHKPIARGTVGFLSLPPPLALSPSLPLFPSYERLKRKGEGGKDNPLQLCAKPRCFARCPRALGSVPPVAVHSWSAALRRGVPLRTSAVSARLEANFSVILCCGALFAQERKRETAACAPPSRKQPAANAADC